MLRNKARAGRIWDKFVPKLEWRNLC